MLASVEHRIARFWFSGHLAVNLPFADGFVSVNLDASDARWNAILKRICFPVHPTEPASN